MSFQKTLEKVESSPEFKEFKKKNPKAKLYSGFFTLRKAFGNMVTDSEQVDYLIGKETIATFLVQDGIIIKKMDKLEKPVEKFTGLDTEIKIDIEKIIPLVEGEIKKQKITSEISKIIAILQKQEKKQIWNIVVVFSSFSLLKLHIDMQGKMIYDEKESVMNWMHVEKGNKSHNQENSGSKK